MSISYSPYDYQTRCLKLHIMKAFKLEVALTKAEFDTGIIAHEGKSYLLVYPKTMPKHFDTYPQWCGTVSFQEHLSGNYAVMR